MMEMWSATDLTAALGVRVNVSVRGIVQFNSKHVQPGDLFIALQSNNGGDGHQFVNDALTYGADAVIVSRLIDNIKNDKIILVNNTKNALSQLANYRHQQLKNTKFIGITGSVGKTSTKEIMFKVFSTCYKTFASRKNFNNLLGMLLNLASVPINTEYAIFELGMTRAGELRELVKILPLNIAILTNINSAHTEFFNSLEHLTESKCEIFDGLVDEGIAVINSDSMFFTKQLEYINKVGISNVFTFGNHQAANSKVTSYYYDSNNQKSVININCNGNYFQFNTQILSYGQALNIAVVLLVSDICKINLTKVIEVINTLKNFEGRGKVYLLSFNSNSLFIIDDCYNANPASMKNALQLLGQIKAKRKVAVLGDMLELGYRAKEHHLNLITYIVECNIYVIAIGSLMKNMYELLPNKLKLNHYNSIYELTVDKFLSLLHKDDYVLIKGSNRMKLSLIIENLLESRKLKDAI
ncbi:UDP-N-acetylmuramoyl-tripeptide--D-alanyl-D-alanine ligase family protein [Orientia chuto str. Dubai]|uniref:UDP-N-acetylmuramoyl-tripeptide--D-alanyl-D-alanine ligase n=1 Tax=Orientia chuto str. Dubai TaxID=1359168 RepID=A0A0F3MJ03_9RICK|nr:UDP-N-acetylmuramoyl-tripeptide--D-alanyl-D-alanine ligase [Candidatus Orientia mediorientalis]KJV55725.1 UDP-N-acetylmuramoyl-tripeptide--D-alanyl-D-alanine ligase family protein [Orientia chuto str. Dubai]